MRRIGDHYLYDHPEQQEPYHWLTHASALLVAVLIELTFPFPWNPWITFWVVLAIAAGERLILRGKRR